MAHMRCLAGKSRAALNGWPPNSGRSAEKAGRTGSRSGTWGKVVPCWEGPTYGGLGASDGDGRGRVLQKGGTLFGKKRT